MTQSCTLKNLILSQYLFDARFILEGKESESGVKDAIDRCLRALYAMTHPGQPDLAEREWQVKKGATPFEKLKAAFRSVIGEDTPPVTPVQKGNPAEYYRNLRNEKLKAGRLALWEALVGTPIKLEDFTGNEIATLFQDWLDENPEALKATHLSLAKRGLSYLPPEIGLLTKLQFLDLSENKLKELPPEIGRLSELMNLGLKNNQLTELPQKICQLPELLLLNISENAFEKLPPEIGQLPHLIYLIPGFRLAADFPSGVMSAMDARCQLDSREIAKLREVGLLDTQTSSNASSRKKK